MMNGKISRVLAEKGFGFIQGDDSQEYFMHRTAIRDGSVFEQLREGQPVTFDASRGDKGPNPNEPRGRASTGMVATITRGRGDGYIREHRGDLLYFNRRDVIDGGFNDLNIGDRVTFEIIEDTVSGYRAARVAQQT